MASSPGWLKWIKPAPNGDAEIQALARDYQILVDEIKTFPSTLDQPAIAREKRKQAKQLRLIVKTLEMTPSIHRGGHFYECRDDLLARAGRLELAAKRIVPKPKRGHPEDEPKRQCWIECYLFLAEHGLEASTNRPGTVQGLARAAWNAATGEADSSFAADAWFQLGRRAFPDL